MKCSALGEICLYTKLYQQVLLVHGCADGDRLPSIDTILAYNAW